MCAFGFQLARDKAVELESFYSPLGEGPARKRPRLDEEDGEHRGGGEEVEGERLIEEFLTAVSSLSLDKMGEAEARAQLSKMVDDVLSSGSPYVSAIVNSQT